ncbi:TM0106 family RecB-like putative nuclease [Burkholderia sp. PR2]|uniref:TM0106 family RecB-like putative nuclease n=1 Tax=Burkholderia sp. PR2 TaxID=3448078 RepID=UPI00402AE5F8
MQKVNGGIAYSASDLVNFLECEHLTSLDLIDLDTPLPRTEDSDEAKLIQDKGHEHEARFLEALKAQHCSFVDIARSGGTLEQKVGATLNAMRNGVEVIYQASLRDGCLIGHADFLRKVDRPSALGNHSYEVLDTKLARSTKAKFIIQLGFYSALLAKAQGIEPLMMHVILGDRTQDSYRCADYAKYLDMLIERFLGRVNGTIVETYPEPCEKCGMCKWSELCEKRRIEDDHLCQVANITKIQTKKLQGAGVPTLAALATLPAGTTVPKLAAEMLDKLHHQAALQLRARETGKNHLELLPRDEAGARGFARLPRPDGGDLFFDMEGDPLEEGGLEYLFGLYYVWNGEGEFKAFWAHSRAEEKVAFEQFMDFVSVWLQQHPAAHIYHYASYEETALKKLMSLHGTCEAEVDNLLRARKLVDLYKVVREGIRVSEPRYSIKNIEHFYLEQRTGDVKNAGASIVYYERWKESGDAQLLKEIEDYNFDDVRSTYELRQWLLTLRPNDIPWAGQANAGVDRDSPEVGEMTDDEKRLVAYRQRLIDVLPEDRSSWGKQEHLRELTYQLLDFHRRAAKPEWWSMFSRMDMTVDELLEDGECLAGLTPDQQNPPRAEKRSIVFTYRFAEQETKLKTGDTATIAQTGESVRELKVDEDNRRVSFKRGADREPLPAEVCLGPGAPVSTKSLREAVFRFAHSVAQGGDCYSAIEAVLTQAVPRIRNLHAGAPIIPDVPDAQPHTVEAVANLDGSYLFIQGPPGAGKTYTGSRIIAALVKRGYRVGVSSNSHKAINNLLTAVEKVASKIGLDFRGVKKSTKGSSDSMFAGTFVDDVFDNDDVVAALDGGAELIAGTAWLFADARLDQTLDYLFVDEAGQVALGNLVAMGTSAKNIVLLGDQMQLGQPVQGIHPGRSGESSLEYLLNGMATIPPERGIFLGTTWRMNPDLCRFISEVVYDGRLRPEPSNSVQRLLLSEGAHPALLPSGLRYVPVGHDSCSQRSEAEASVVRELVESLLAQRYRDKQGREQPIALQDILVVAPYNMQVNLLKQVLPEGARVGTVDKFQGQEAEVVIVSMATSSGDYLPRNIEFLYSKNRLNVAISRAKCLALFVANPALMAIRCTKPEEMALVNALCWVKDYSDSFSRDVSRGTTKVHQN